MNTDIVNFLRAGKALAQEGNWEGAIDKWNKAIELSSYDVEIISVVATFLAESGKLDEVKVLVEHMAVANPEAAAVLVAQIGLDRWEKHQDVMGAVQLCGLSLKIARANDNIQQLAFTSGNLGNILSAAGSLEASLIHYENGEKYYQQIDDTEWVSQMLSSGGGVLKDLSRFEEAAEKLAKAIAIASQNHHFQALALGLLNQGSLYGILQKFEQSSRIHQQVIHLAWENQLPDYFRKAVGNLAVDLRSLKLSGAIAAKKLVDLSIEAYREEQYDWAIFGLKCATLLVDKKMDPIGLADIYHSLSNIEYSIGEMDGAIVHLEESGKLAREVQADAPLAEYSAGLSHLLLEQGKLTEAVAACDEAIACATRSEAYEPLTTALGNRGIVALKQDKLQMAKTLLFRQYNLAKEKGYQKQCANAANSLGAVFERIGDILAAEKWFKVSIKESEDYKWPAGLSSLVNMATLQRRRGEINMAISTYQDALIQAIGKSSFDQLFDVVFNLGILYAKTNQLEKAKSYFDQATEWNKSIDDPRKRALLDMNEAFLLKQEGKRMEALEKFTAAYTFFKESDWENAAKCAVEAAILLMDLGRLEEAMQQILPAVKQFEQRMTKVSDHDAWRLHRDEELCFQVFLELTMQLYGSELALIASERSRGRAFRLALRRREAGHRTKVFETKQIISKAALEGVISGKAKGLKKAYLDRFIEVLSGAKAPRELNLDIAWVKEWAGKLETSFVVYTKGYPDKLYAWVINQTEIQCTLIELNFVDGISGLEECIEELRKHLGIPERGAGVVQRDRQKNPNALLRKLHKLLIEPLTKWLPDGEGAKICFVPWGPLFEVPFCALLDDKGRYLVDRYASFIVPTLYFFGSEQEKHQGDALIVGDPLPFQRSSFGELSRLPFAIAEARQVAKLYEAQPLIGEEASKKKVLEKLSSASIVHFAAHGLFNETYPLRSAIALTQTGDDDGLLYANELKKMMLKNRLVVLSACSSALGNITGDGVLGLCREFLTAGTDSIVASIWAVGDRSSAFHMTHFHKALTEKTAIEALREAQLATKQEFDNVSQWGAYGLWGWPV